LRKIIGVTWKDKVSNAEALARTGQRRLQDIVGKRRFRFAGHVMRMTPCMYVCMYVYSFKTVDKSQHRQYRQ